MLEGALILLAGLVVGRFAPGRRRGPKPSKPRPEPQPICGCGHHFAMHDPESKACHGTVKTPKYNVVGDRIGYTYPACNCRQYVGPVPMPEYYATEIAGPQ